MKYLMLILISTLALWSQDQAKPADYIAHEWGTFTSLRGSDGALLSGLHIEEEALPRFVYGHMRPNYKRQPMQMISKGISKRMSHDTIRMETPVVYFYSKKAMNNLGMYIGFRGGSISQWYPAREWGETLGTLQNDLDFSKRTNGSIYWKFDILAPDSDAKMISQNTTHTWLAPRATDANKIAVTYDATINNKKQRISEVEKFLFYRGVGNFSLPLTITNPEKDTLLLSNNKDYDIPYLLIYEKKKDQPAHIWWSGTLGKGKSHKQLRPLNSVDFSTESHPEFIDELVKAGLYKKEAEAMLETWKQSYFENDGLKVFWIVPEVMTNRILPASISPAPKSFKRVLVGRSEILTREFEQHLLDEDKKDGLKKYKHDRFRIAYRERVNAIKEIGK